MEKEYATKVVLNESIGSMTTYSTFQGDTFDLIYTGNVETLDHVILYRENNVKVISPWKYVAFVEGVEKVSLQN